MIAGKPAFVKMAEKMLERGVFVVGFFYPVVPQGKARIRAQVSAAHTRERGTKDVDVWLEPCADDAQWAEKLRRSLAAFPSARPYDLRRSTTIDIDDIAETVFSDGVVRIVGFDRSQEVPIGVAYFELGA